MKDQEVKFYKNKYRQEDEKYQPYVPNYVSNGIDPQEMNFGSEHLSSELDVETKATVLKFKPVTQPYAETVNSPLGNSTVPNVGNNFEHTWSSVDGDIVDDLPQEFKEDHQMIDNNDFVTEKAMPSFGGFSRNRNSFIQIPQPVHQADPPQPKLNELLDIVSDLEANTYLLIVNGNALCSGPLNEIEDQVSALILGNHELFDGAPVAEEKIIVLKKIPIKVGVFLG